MIPSYWRLAAVLVLLVIVVRVTAESFRVSENRDRNWRLQRQLTRVNAQLAADDERYHLSAESERFGPTEHGEIFAFKGADTLRSTSRRRNIEPELSQLAEGVKRSANEKDRQIRDVHYRRVADREDSRTERRHRFELDPVDDLLVRTHHRRMVEDRRSKPIIANHLNRIERSSAASRREVNIRSGADNRRSNNFIREDQQEISQFQRNDRSNAPMIRNSLNNRVTVRTEDDDGEQERIERRSIIHRDDTNLGDRNRLSYRSSRRNMAAKRFELNQQGEHHRSRRYNYIKKNEQRENTDDQNLRFNRRNQLNERRDQTSVRTNRFDSRRGIEDRSHRSLKEEISRNNRRVTETLERSDRLVDQRAGDTCFAEETNVRRQSFTVRPFMSIRENNEKNIRLMRDLKEHVAEPENRRTIERSFERVTRHENSVDRRQDDITRNARLITYPSVRSETLEEHIAVQRNIISTEAHNLGNDRSVVERATAQLNERRDSHADRNILSVRENRQNPEQNDRRFSDRRVSRNTQESIYRRQNRADKKVRSIRQDNVPNDERVVETIKRLERLEDHRASDVDSERITRQSNNRRSFLDDTRFEGRRNRFIIQADRNQDNTRVEREERRVFLKSNRIDTRVADSRTNDNIPRSSLVNNEIDGASNESTNRRNRMDRTKRLMQADSMSRFEDMLENRIDKTRNLNADARIGSKWSWQLCQALLISAILAQFLKNRDGLDKRMRYICN